MCIHVREAGFGGVGSGREREDGKGREREGKLVGWAFEEELMLQS